MAGYREDFLRRIMPYAQQVSQRTGLDWRIPVAQAALESNWGRSAPGNNYFGIKGPGQTLATKEVIGGKTVGINDSFRTYDGMGESVQGYGDFLQKNPRYQPMLNAQGVDAQIDALGKSGYATDPEYAKKIRSIVGGLGDGLSQIPTKIASAANNVSGLLAPKEQGAFYQDKIQGPQQPTAGMTGGGGGLLAGGFGLNGPQAQDTPMTINQGQNSSLPSFARPDAPLFDMKGLTPTGGGGGLGGALGGLSAIASALGGGGGGESKASLPQLPTPAPMPAHTPKTEGVQAMSAQRRNEAFSLLAPRRRGRDPLSLLG
ncbi:glucosaminidase domain-containing protein [Chelatococcus sp.]|uniref:glycoside hydrolase family 73 protein n=1 Tax=Chelatococcus sp. TaxID=1953771 RepID=UPI001ED31132|nr:glucosaminidase domain-containing protein [Chelatococcus sp.]MBX3543230.1 glucosaminidase domain-containing protein [Chelatococcus sp.]